MKVEVEKPEPSIANILLELPADLAAQEYHKACRRLSQRLNVPGFRRGKVPRNIVEKTIGIERIKQEALDRVLPNLLAGAISEHRLEAVSSPSIESYSFDLEQGIKVKATVALRPEVTLPDLALSVEVEKFLPPADTFDQALAEITNRLTTLEPVIDRPAEATDIVNIDFTGTVENAPIKGGAAKNYRLDLKENNFIEGFSDQVIGHSLGEEFAITVTFPEQYHDAALAGKPADFKIKLNEINRRVVPELNDELAKRVGNFDSKDALLESLKAGIDAQSDLKNQQNAEFAIIEKLVSLSKVDVPDVMTQREAKLLMDGMRQQLSKQGLPWETYLEAQGGQEAAWNNCKQEAEKRLKTTLVFGTVAKELALRVLDVEFFEAVREFAQARRVDEKAMMRQLGNNPGAVQGINDQVLAQKVLTALMEKASITWLEPAEKPADETTSTSSGALSASSPDDAPLTLPAVTSGDMAEDYEVIA